MDEVGKRHHGVNVKEELEGKEENVVVFVQTQPVVVDGRPVPRHWNDS